MGPTQKLLHSKGNHKPDGKTTYRMGENICKWCNQQRIRLQNLQTAHATHQKNKQPNQKWAEADKGGAGMLTESEMSREADQQR